MSETRLFSVKQHYGQTVNLTRFEEIDRPKSDATKENLGDDNNSMDNDDDNDGARKIPKS